MSSGSDAERSDSESETHVPTKGSGAQSKLIMLYYLFEDAPGLVPVAWTRRSPKGIQIQGRTKLGYFEF